MKSIWLWPLLLSLGLLLAACGSLPAEQDSGERAFQGRILALDENEALVEPLDGEPVRSSADQITFGLANLDEIGASVGDVVNVVYTGNLAESYPAQVQAVSWSLVERGAEELGSGREVVSYGEGYANLELTLPPGWAYRLVAAGENDLRPENFGIHFWPESDSELVVELEYYPGGIGLCGTGVTFTEVDLPNGYTATACTEQGGDWSWYLLLYNGLAGLYAGECTTSPELWQQYEAEILDLLVNAVLAQDTLDQAAAEAGARQVYAGESDQLWSDFDHQSGQWTVEFLLQGQTQATVMVDSQGQATLL